MKNKIKNFIILIMLFLSITGFIYSFIHIIIWKIDNYNNQREITKITDLVIIEEQENVNEEEIIPNNEENKFDPYWDYIKLNLIDVDFNALENINTNIVGWLQLPGTNVNYPFVQSSDNDYYLTHSFNKSYNKAGWIFLDYRNNSINNNKHSIIYGHALKAGSMFGTLKNLLTDSWLNNKKYHIIKTSTKDENSLWQIFSIYTIPDTSDYLKIDFKTNEEYKDFLNLISRRTIHDFGTTVNENDQILTLSTCYKTSSTKMAVHAKLIKTIKKS